MVTREKLDITSRIIMYEEGELDFGDEIELFQDLIDTGIIYSLQGVYQRRMATLIDNGLVAASSRARLRICNNDAGPLELRPASL